MSAFAGSEPALDVVVPDAVRARRRQQQQQQQGGVQAAASGPVDILKVRNVGGIDHGKLLLLAPGAFKICMEELPGVKEQGGGYGRVEGVVVCPRTGLQAPVSVFFHGWVHSAVQKGVIKWMLDVCSAPGTAYVSEEAMK